MVKIAHNWMLSHDILGTGEVTRCPARCPAHDHSRFSCKCKEERCSTCGQPMDSPGCSKSPIREEAFHTVSGGVGQKADPELVTPEGTIRSNAASVIANRYRDSQASAMQEAENLNLLTPGHGDGYSPKGECL